MMLIASVAGAMTFTAGPADYLQQLRRLGPGDTLVLLPGEYRHGLPIHGLAGSAARPIVVRGLSRDERPVFVARPGHNTVSIADARHVMLRDLVIDGRDLPVDGVKAEGTSRYADFITLDNLLIVRHGVDQSIVGISTQCPVRGWVIRRNEIIGAGTGMYLGGSDGNAPFVAGTIEGNRIVDTLGYNLQVKHQLGRPLDSGSSLDQITKIEGNVFSKSGRASTGRDARPNVLLGHFPPAGAGSHDWYVVRGNLFYDNPAERLLQAEGRVRISNNVFVNPSGSAVVLMPHKGRTVEAIVDNNTVVARDEGIRLTGATASTAVFANLVVAGEPLPGLEGEANALYSIDRASVLLRNPLGTPPALDVTVRPESSALLPAASKPHVQRATVTSIGWQVTGGSPAFDFAGRPRTSQEFGAFVVGGAVPITLGGPAGTAADAR